MYVVYGFVEGLLVVVGLFVKGEEVGRPGRVVIGRPVIGVVIGIFLNPPTTFPVTVAAVPPPLGIYCETVLTPGIELVRFYAVLVRLLILLPTVPNALVGFYATLTGREMIVYGISNKFDKKLMYIY